MKIVQMTLGKNSSGIAKKGTKHPGLTRSILKKVQINELKRKHREGYTRKPVKRGEFSDWESEQVWVEP
jgi:hypothetical protein